MEWQDKRINRLALLASNDGAGRVGTADGRTVQKHFDDLPQDFDIAGAAVAAVAGHDDDAGAHPALVAAVAADAGVQVQAHDDDAGAHPALSAFISAEADRAEAAKDAAQLSAGVYVDTAAGLAATVEGDYFNVPSADDAEFIVLYRHDAGPVATEIKRYPSAAVVENKISGVASKNLFDVSDANVALGYFPVDTTGNLQANASYNTTGFIPVVPGLSYTVSFKHYLVWYDAAQVYISGSGSGDTNKTQVAPGGAAFMRCSSSLSKWDLFQVEQGAGETGYEPYGMILPKERVRVGSIPADRLVPKSVGIDQAAFMTTGKNLFNKYSVMAGYYIGHDGTAPVQDANYHASDFIRVSEGATYSAEAAGVGPRFITYYSGIRQFVAGGISAPSRDVLTFVPPAGVEYVKITIAADDIDVFQVEAGASPTAYEAYGYRILGENGEPYIMGPLADGSISAAKTDFLKRSKNLFDKNAITAGFISANGNISASGTYSYSDYIAVTPDVEYHGKGAIAMRMLAYYDSDLNVVAGGSDNALSTFTPPAGVSYARITVTTTDSDAFQLEVGGAATAYEAYGYVFEGPAGEPLVGLGAGSGGGWAGKKWATLGDSITAQAKWQAAVVAALGLVWANYGVGGTKISGANGDANAMCQDARIDAIAADRDLVTIMGGTNDWAQNVALGVPSSSDPLTFYGALNALFEKLLARFPDRRIAIFTTPYGEIYDYVPRGWADAKTNTQGLTTWDYAEAVRVASTRWGVPCIDVSGRAGWNAVNIATYVTDDGALLHPNTAGAARVSEVVIGGLKTIEPLS